MARHSRRYQVHAAGHRRAGAAPPPWLGRWTPVALLGVVRRRPKTTHLRARRLDDDSTIDLVIPSSVDLDDCLPVAFLRPSAKEGIGRFQTASTLDQTVVSVTYNIAERYAARRAAASPGRRTTTGRPVAATALPPGPGPRGADGLPSPAEAGVQPAVSDAAQRFRVVPSQRVTSAFAVYVEKERRIMHRAAKAVASGGQADRQQGSETLSFASVEEIAF